MDRETSLAILGLSYAGKEGIKVVGQFMKDILGPSTKAAGRGLAAPLEAWAKRRIERGTATVFQAAEEVNRRSEVGQPVPGGVLFTILENASLEENPEMHERWVQLLAQAAGAPESVPPMYPRILSEIAVAEVQMMVWIQTVRGEVMPQEFVGRWDETSVELAVLNLARLGLVSYGPVDRDLEYRRITKPFRCPLRLTRLGIGLIHVCSTKKSSREPIPETVPFND